MKNLRARSAILKKTKFGRLKSLFSLLGLLLVTNFIYGQNYEPIVDTSKMWVVLTNSSIEPPYYNGGVSFAYKIEGSTLFEEEYWMTLWESADSTYSDWSVKGYMKENDSIVLFMDLANNIYTLYDFTLKAGEMVVSEECELPVDSISTSNFIGKDRFTLHISDYHYYDVKYYEGIGSNAGLLTPLYNCSTGASRYLICYYENGELKYQNENFNSCNYNVTSISNQIERNIFIYPNPCNDNLVLKNTSPSSTSIVTFELYNNMGELLKKIKLQHPTVHINVSTYTSGIYYYRLYSNNQNLQKGILIKK